MEVVKDARVELSLGSGTKSAKVDVVLRGSERAIAELLSQIGMAARPIVLEVTGGTCCWTFSRGDSTIHLVVDGAKL